MKRVVKLLLRGMVNDAPKELTTRGNKSHHSSLQGTYQIRSNRGCNHLNRITRIVLERYFLLSPGPILYRHCRCNHFRPLGSS